MNIPSSEDYDITYNGTDYEQVVDTDYRIYQPIVDTEVSVSFKLVDKKTKDYTFKEIRKTNSWENILKKKEIMLHQ